MNSGDTSRDPIAVVGANAPTTLVGSVPGTDVWEATAVVRGELPDFPILPELPDRGPGADMVGRTMSMLAGISSEFAVTTTPTGWRFAGHRGSALPSVMRRAASWLGEDLDAAERSFAAFEGCYKIQVVGPWTLAASIELANGDRLLNDAGAVADLLEALAEVVRDQIVEVRRRLPAATIFLQLDEPMLDRVIQGAIQTPSGFSAYAPLPEPRVAADLKMVLGAARHLEAVVGVHTCAANAHLDVLRAADCDFVSCDLSLLAGQDAVALANCDEEMGQLLDSGKLLFAGLIGNAASRPDPRQRLLPLTAMLARLGIPPESVLNQLVLTPTCGLAGAGSLANVRAVTSELNAAGRRLRDERAMSGERDD